MMTWEQAQAIYRAGEETVVRVLLELSREMEQLKADFAVLTAESAALPSTDLDRFLKRYLQIVNAGYTPRTRPPNRLPDQNAGAAASRAKPATCSTASATILTASSLSCVTSRCPSTTTSRSAICG